VAPRATGPESPCPRRVDPEADHRGQAAQHLIRTTHIHDPLLSKVIQSKIFEEILDSHLQQLLQSEWSSSSHLILSGQNSDLLLQSSSYVPHLSFEPERCDVRLVLLHATTLSPQLLRGNRGISYRVRLSSRSQKKHPSPSLCQDVARRQPQVIYQLLSEPVEQSLQLWWGGLCTHIHQRVTGHSPLYKHLLKHNVAEISEILSQAQPYLQLEKVMKTSSNHYTKPSDGGGKSKSTHEIPNHAQDRHRWQPAYKKHAFSILPLVSIWSASYSLEKNSVFWQFSNMDMFPILVSMRISYFSKELLIWVRVRLASSQVPIQIPQGWPFEGVLRIQETF